MSAPSPRPAGVHGRPSALYQISLFAVALTMAILPCVYLALTALTVCGIYYFATHGVPAIWRWPTGSSHAGFMAQLLCTITPLLAGSAVTFSFVKPLFARRPARMEPLALDPQAEPRVYALVQEICRRMGAPAPRRVVLDGALNASARFEGGGQGFFGNALILTLGMPLVACLTQRELAGVVAHEFSHFRQGTGMRLSYLIRGINLWFARVIYERDAWDYRITWAAESTENLWLVMMLNAVRASVAIARGLLWRLMMGGHLVGAVLLRQMEL